MAKIAAAVFSFKRAEYLKKVLDSLHLATGSEDIDWYGFQDGAFNPITESTYATPEEINDSLQLLKDSPLNFKDITVNEFNRSIAVQKQKAHKLFESYETVFFFEDDLVVGQHYLYLLRQALEQFPDHAVLMNTHPPVGNNLNDMRQCKIARIWGYGMNAGLYNKIKPGYDNFHNGIQHVDYIKRHSTPRVKRKYGMSFYSHDKCISVLSRQLGSGKIWPYVSRGVYIGRKGNIAYRTDKTWFKRGMNSQSAEITYRQDRIPKRFRLR